MDPKNDGRGLTGVEELAFALASVSRWRLLQALSEGGTFSVSELAKRLGLKQSTASKHMLLLAKAGIVRSGKGRLYELSPGLLAGDGSRDVRLGLCTLHFGKPAGGGED